MDPVRRSVSALPPPPSAAIGTKPRRGETRSPDGASRDERRDCPLGWKHARQEGRRAPVSPQDREPFAVGVSQTHPARPTACLPRQGDCLPLPPGSGSRSPNGETDGDALFRDEARRDGEIRSSSSEPFQQTSGISPNVSKVGPSRAPTRFAEGRRFAAPSSYGPRSRSLRRSVGRGARDSSIGSEARAAPASTRRPHFPQIASLSSGQTSVCDQRRR
jgi:hypothetical protein